MSTFDAVPGQPDWPALERAVMELWSREGTFERLRTQNADGERWSFLDGPITANNPMGVHHAWGRTYKDVWQRYHAMAGQAERWQNGFDCQGLWVEVEVEKELGFKSKHDIESYGIARFVRRCKERVLRFAALMTEQSQRLGMWMRWDDPATLRWLADHIDEAEPVTVQTPDGPVTDTVEALVGKLGGAPWHGSYFTFSDENNYTIWGFLKQCHDRGWIYKGTDVMPWCTRCGTGLSQHEIATEGYQERTHRSPTLKLPLRGRPGEALLVWTTTPWTLPANVAAAVGPELTYLKVRQGDEVYYLAKGAAPKALPGELDVLGELKGRELVGWTYDGPFDHLPAAAEAAEAHVVIPWDEVGEEEGTGIVHIAPGCGAEDFALGKEHGLPVVAPLTEAGNFVEGFGELSGLTAQEASEAVLADLKARGLVLRVEGYTHRYPVCWRCQSELVFRLVDEWFISMGPSYDKPRAELSTAERAASLRYQVMDVVDEIEWVPAFGRDREMDWLRNMHDWMISKKRYWGLALPIWVCEDCGEFEVIGSREELRGRAVTGWDAFDGHSPHRPYVDKVELHCSECGGTSRRIPDVGNPWLDAGSVPFSTMGYGTDREEWARWFPADFITECFPGQFRNWFYSLLVMSTVLESAAPFKAILGYGLLLAEDGREMHKSWGNAIAFDEAADAIGADVMRWMFLAHKPEQNLLFGYHGAAEVRRRFLIPMWNVYGFLVQYANVADWEPGGPAADEGELDRWIRLRLAETASATAASVAAYDPQGVATTCEAFAEDLSNWYVRRSRRRFWEGDPAALQTLHAVLVDLARVLAPFLPFTAESIYQNLAGASAPASVHLASWPSFPEPSASDQRLIDEMGLVVRLAGLGRAARSAADVKLRQPLAQAKVAVRTPDEATAVERLAEHLREELNVKEVEVVRGEGDLVTYSIRPLLPALGPKYGPRVPAIRRALEAAEAAAVASAIRAGDAVTLRLDEGEVTLLPDEIEVLAGARPGLATAAEDGYVVGVVTELTPELLAEGVARDVVRHVNQLRKDAGLAITDRIRLSVEAPEEVRVALGTWQGYVTGETLAERLDFGPPSPGGHTATVQLDDHSVRLGVARVEV